MMPEDRAADAAVEMAPNGLDTPAGKPNRRPPARLSPGPVQVKKEGGDK